MMNAIAENKRCLNTIIFRKMKRVFYFTRLRMMVILRQKRSQGTGIPPTVSPLTVTSVLVNEITKEHLSEGFSNG